MFKMLRRSNIVVLCLSFLMLGWTKTNIVNAAAGKNDKEPMRDDDQGFETNIPTSTPFTANMNDNDGTMFTPVSTTVENQGGNNTTVNAPVMAPVVQENSDTTEDLDEDETMLTNQMKESCRAVSRGIAVTTNTSMQVIYKFDILTSTATPLYTGIAVNNAVTNYLMGRYIKPYCNTENTNRYLRSRQRSLQSSNSSTSFFAYGDVRGVARGTTTVVTDETCYVPVEDTGIVACYRLQTSNIIYFRNDYIQLDGDGQPIVDDIENEILTDISTAFKDNTIETNVVKGGETGLQGSSYTSGAVSEISVQGKKIDSSSTERGNNSNGLTRAGKAFLTLFLLCLIGVLCYFGYKYGYPKFKEHYPHIKERLAQARPRNGATTAASNAERSFQAERANPFMTLYERFQRKVPNEVNRPYDFIVPDSKLDRNDRNVLISDTMESSSTDGYGTEMILEDLQDEEVRLSPTVSTPSSSDYRFTPSTLPNTKEYDRTEGKRLTFEHVTTTDDNDQGQADFDADFSNNDAFSFSDVNIVIDDSSSYGSTVPPNFVAANVPIRRPYSVPDTVNL